MLTDPIVPPLRAAAQSSRRLRQILPAILLTLACSLPAVAQQPGLTLTGNESAVWLAVRKDKQFDLLARSAGGQWDWVSRDNPGQLGAAAAEGRKLLVLLNDPRALGAFPLDREAEGPPPSMSLLLTPANPQWPPSAPAVAMTIVDKLGDAKEPTLIVVALVGVAPAKGTATATATAATTRTTPAATAAARTAPAATRPVSLSRLAAFARAGDKWTHLGSVDVRHRAGDRVLAAASEGKLLVMLSGPGHPNRLMTIGGSDVPLSGDLAQDQALSMVDLQGRLILLMAKRQGPTDAKVYLTQQDRGKWTSFDVAPPPPLKAWHWANLPQGARLAQKLELVWQQDGKIHAASCEPSSGKLSGAGEIKALSQPPQGLGMTTFRWFMIGIFILLLALVFFLRPRTLPKPFIVPPDMIRGNLLKRLVAGVIDFGPFLLLASAVAIAMGWAPPRMTFQEAIAALQEGYPLSDGMYFVSAGMIAAFVVYCIIMEHRLGATVGKLAMGLRVTGDDGQRATLHGVVVRNLMKVMELFWPWMLPMLFIFPLFSRNRQRLGDMLARTTVVEKRRLTLPPQPPQPREPLAGDEEQ